MEVTWFSREFLPEAGEFGILPTPGYYAQSTTRQDLDTLAKQSVARIVCLQEAHEFERLEPPETLESRTQTILERGMQFTHIPIEDFCSPTLEQANTLVSQLRNDLQHNLRVVVHCFAGLGRAGTVAACLLTSYGMSAQDAIALVRWYRPGAIQSTSQEQLIHIFEKEGERFPSILPRC